MCIARPCRPVPGTSYCSGQNVSPPKTSSLCSKAMFIFFFRSRLPVWMENKYLFAILLSMLLVSGPEAESLDHVMIPFDFLGPVFQFLHFLEEYGWSDSRTKTLLHFGVKIMCSLFFT